MYVYDNDSNILKNQPTKTEIKPLTIDDKPVFSSKNIFGKYNFKPKK